MPQRVLKARNFEAALDIADFLWGIKNGEYVLVDVNADRSLVKVDYKKT